MAQVINTDVRTALNEAIDMINGPLVSSLNKGMERTVDIAKKTGAPNFIRSSEDAVDPTATMVKVFKDLGECCEEYATKLEKLNKTLGE